jgi:iron complex transport system substrate-binding protein
LASETKTKPTVFSDKYFNGQWYVPGGQSYISRLFSDAGADYLWSDDPHYSSFPLDYEVVFGKAHDADFWRIVGSYGDTPTYAGLEAENGLYKHFKAFQDRKVIYCNARESAYFETSPLEPQLILGDLIKAFHPELLPDYTPKYYKVLP